MKYILGLESHLFASLASPKRLQILHLLQHGSLSVNQMAEMTNMRQAAVSQNLAVLRQLKLVKSKREAQIRVYSLASKHVAQIFSAMRLVLLEKYGVNEAEALNALHFHTDPICGMELTALTAVSSVVVNRRRYYFCGKGCEKRFLSSQHDMNTSRGKNEASN